MLRARLLRGYFDRVYNPLYDASTGRLTRYRQAQERVAAILDARGSHNVLCVGLGTGNELKHLFARAPGVRIVGVDYSPNALRLAARRSHSSSRSSLLLMDAHTLAFRDGCFDRVLSYHLTDFLPAPLAATEEMLRVLRPGGRFVMSFPSETEGLGLGIALFRQGFENPSTGNQARRLRGALAAMLAGLLYSPLMLRRVPAPMSQSALGELLRPLGVSDLSIETDPVYRDHIVTGTKLGGQQ